MDLLANYGDDNTQENSVSRSPSPSKKVESSKLENEWLSFEQMISQTADSKEPVVQSDFLVGGIVAYPGMNSSHTKPASPKLVNQLYKSCANDDNPDDISGDQADDVEMPRLEEDDDAFFRLRKQVKERDRSSSSNRSGSSGSSSASSSRSGSPEKEGSPSPPHLSPQTTTLPTDTPSAPPDITDTAPTTAVKEKTPTEDKGTEKKDDPKSHVQSKSRERRRSRDRKRSHRSKHHRSSKSRRRRSGSRSQDKRRRHDRHRRRRSKDRKSSKDYKKEIKDRRDSSKTDDSGRKNSTSKRKNSESKASDSHRDSHKRHSRSKSRDRDHKKDKKEGRSRHRSGDKRKRSHSRDGKRKHRSRSRHRSRSPHNRNKDRHSRSRSRERLRSRSPIGVRKLTFKEQMRKQFIDASKEMAKDKAGESAGVPVRRPGGCLKPSDLLKGVKLNSGDSVTPQMALMQTMAAMHKQAQELTGVEVPKYYNPAAVNPLKYAEQIKKRKLLWAKKDEEKEKNDQIETQWKSAFIEEDDGKTATKFRKLMGMKGESAEGGEEVTEDIQKLSDEQRRKHQEMFDRLDQEYSFARITTHTQRGVGLGFSSAIIDPNHPSLKPP